MATPRARDGRSHGLGVRRGRPKESPLWDVVPPSRTYRCSKCDADLDSPMAAENHFYFLHLVPRDVARAAIASVSDG